MDRSAPSKPCGGAADNPATFLGLESRWMRSGGFAVLFRIAPQRFFLFTGEDARLAGELAADPEEEPPHPAHVGGGGCDGDGRWWRCGLAHINGIAKGIPRFA